MSADNVIIILIQCDKVLKKQKTFSKKGGGLNWDCNYFVNDP